MPHPPMRRRDREITDADSIEAIIRGGQYCVVGLCDGERPYPVPLSYGYEPEHNRLYFHVAPEGRKLDIVASNPMACAVIVAENGYTQGECEHPFESVMLFGRMRIVEDDDEKRHAIGVLVEQLEHDPETYWATRTWELDKRLKSFLALSLDIERVSAKRGK